MLQLLIGLILAGVSLVALGLLKTYQHVPAKELKRLARQGDPVADLFYRPVAYGLSLQLLLWFIAGLSFAASVILFAKALPLLLALPLVAIIVWTGFAWIPAGRLSKPGLWFARRAAPPLVWLLERLRPVTNRTATFVRKHRPVIVHTGLYQKSDLVDLLEQQKAQADNRISGGEIELLQHALTFGDKLVVDALIPKRVVEFANADDAIGPALMTELHKKGHSRFPVYETKHDNIVGIVYLRDLVSTIKTGKVRDIMKPRLSYVHEDFTLYQTLQAFIKTKQHLFLVVNSFEELVGIITVEDVIGQMVGQMIVDEFDSYEDLRAVATAAAKDEHQSHVTADAEVQEVVE